MALKQYNRGFSLIEIIVGVLIAMLATLTIFGAYALSERQKRTTTGAAGAQTNGALALHILERDIKMAGFGLEPSAVETCAKLFTYDSDSGGPIDNFFAGIIITDGGVKPDSFTVRYFGDPTRANIDFSRATLTKNMPNPSAELDVSRTGSCAKDNLAFLKQDKDKMCTLTQVTLVQNTPDKLHHSPGSRYNPSTAYQAANHWPAYGGCTPGNCDDSASVQCFTDIFKRNYSIDNGLNLQLIEEKEAAGVTTTQKIAQQIVEVQAEYGVSIREGVQTISAWAPATGEWASPLDSKHIRRIKAVRLAIVARSTQPEKPNAAGVCTTTTAGMVAAWPASSWANFNNIDVAPDWECYRYKVFETVIPLRNVIWGNV